MLSRSYQIQVITLYLIELIFKSFKVSDAHVRLLVHHERRLNKPIASLSHVIYGVSCNSKIKKRQRTLQIIEAMTRNLGSAFSINQAQTFRDFQVILGLKTKPRLLPYNPYNFVCALILSNRHRIMKNVRQPQQNCIDPLFSFLDLSLQFRNFLRYGFSFPHPLSRVLTLFLEFSYFFSDYSPLMS